MPQAFLQAQQAHDPLEVRRGRDSHSRRDIQRDLDVGTRVERRQQIELLENKSNLAFAQLGAFGVGELGEVVSVNDHVAAIGPSQSAQAGRRA